DLLGTASRQAVAFAVDRDGPVVGLQQVKLRNGMVHLSGQIEDRTGIRQLAVDGNVIMVNGARSYPLDLAVPLRPGSRVEIRALDLLGNETIALCDSDQELAAFAPRRVLLAAAGPMVLFDREPPTLTLRDSAELPAVFVDRYYVEGEAADAGGVERVLVGGHEVALARGKKVFFSKVVKLREGQNRIQVEAFDRAGNRSQASLVITRVIPAARQVGSRMSISLIPFDGRVISAGLGPLADDLLLGAFVAQKRFQVVERARLQQVLREQKLAADRLTDPEHSVRVGRLVAADAILATTFREDAKSLEVVTRVINTETAEVMAVKDVYTEDRSKAAVQQQMEGLAAKVAGSFPLAEGMVIGREKRVLLADLGSTAQVRKSMGAIIYRYGKELKHPVTGRSLGRDMVKLGEGWFEEVQAEYSRLRLSDRAKPQEIVVKDLLITR
ncbi:MAG TPA: CsgG/HfaB family protein, partial [Geobacteraceae bacterium]